MENLTADQKVYGSSKPRTPQEIRAHRARERKKFENWMRRKWGGISRDVIYYGRDRGPCPVCRTLNRRDGYGPVACRECGLPFMLVAQQQEPPHDRQD